MPDAIQTTETNDKNLGWNMPPRSPTSEKLPPASDFTAAAWSQDMPTEDGLLVNLELYFFRLKSRVCR